ncbi:MAG: AraC family transcriptional regulator of adaptative response [Saprospiraceae bacterium]|jgi:AraC family transcriptional regulator of adaptative response/methylated-DNA-[protein]-cysteine methyltransferase
MQITDEKIIKEYYTALVDRNESYLDKFLVGVKTTGIFCIATCRARKPKYENVEFFEDVKDVLRHGYRPCKVCKPTDNKNEPSEDILKAMQLVREAEDKKVQDWQLKEAGLSPEKIRRWFKKNHGITFQAYQRMLRINTAFQELQTGKSVADSAFESGYNSLSGFGYTFKKLTGLSPEEAKGKNIILMTRFDTPVGPMFACATEKGICLLEFTDRRMLETEFEDLQRRLDAIILLGENEHLRQLKKEMKEYFGKKRMTFDVKLDTPTTPFRQQVWEKLVEVPFGQTASYKEQAIKLGNVKAVRAVANANGHNRVAIVIPCHRVIGSDGSLTGYAGGLDRKKWLLQHEGSYKTPSQLSMFEE